MSERYAFPQLVNAAALLRELQAAGVAAGMVNPTATGCAVDLDPAQYDAAAAVVAAHDKAAADAADAQARSDDDSDRATAWNARQQLASERDLLADTTKTIALADVRRILLLVVRVQLAILRYLHRRGL